jgi:SAM-dependent methyltransferase
VERRDRVRWIYTSRDNEELAERYDRWAEDYDVDLDEEFGWMGPQRAVELFSRYVPKEAKILDAGAGTGLVGHLLKEQGYEDLTAMDLSTGMLEEARKKNAYLNFHQMVMGERLDYEDGCFDAVISVGVMTVGHAPASSLDELVRTTKPGGHIVFTLRPDVYKSDGFKEMQEQLEAAGRWQFLEVSETFRPLPKGEPEVQHQVWVYKVHK